MTPEMKQFLEGMFQQHNDGLQEFVTKANDQFAHFKDDLKALQLKFEGSYSDGGVRGAARLSDRIVQSEQFKHFTAQGARNSGRIEVKSFFEHKALAGDVSASGGALVSPMRIPGILTPGQQRLTIRDLLNTAPTASNAVEYVKETSFTNNAAIINSGGRRETVAKPESAMTFEKATQTVETLAHWIPASRQILSDVPALQNYLDTRLRYGLKVEEEDEILNGDGTAGHLDGLIHQATAFDYSALAAGSTMVDVLGYAIAQAEDESDFEVDGIVLNTRDWHDIKSIKNDLGEYLFVNPQGVVIPTLWGKAVVPTKRIARGNFLVGSFRIGATIWDRMEASVEISREHADFFVKNMAAILCEERLALTVTRPQAFVTGSYVAP